MATSGVAGFAGAQVQLTQLADTVGIGDIAAEPPCPVIRQTACGAGCVEISIGGQPGQGGGLHRTGCRCRRPADVIGHAFGEPARGISCGP
ncbi:hypothetical protein ATO49_17450 [Mycolicibacterium fortuitum subsp. fortuitum DSM 46621 = ATCC 6841 = JCM 6387]|nr:hypothetical protein ATO49_17450 [Mycolicibacterium fortuitum subsp. fortuitum DSM 46621 = ATCC 6841 = JCM 6387]